MLIMAFFRILVFSSSYDGRGKRLI
jgi:hypothetical protein